MINLQSNPCKFIGAIIIGASLSIISVRPIIALDLDEIASLADEITVKITDPDSGYNGSGVIFKQEDGIYYVLSNQHVVVGGSTHEIETVDGITHPVVFKQEIPGLDLAVLQFESEEFYQVASMGDSENLTPLQTIYVAGFPASQTNLDITSGEIRAIDRDIVANPKNQLGYALLYTNQTLPGSSGGPVIDEDGRLVGINGEAERDAISGRDLSRGIPINLFKSLALDFESQSQYEPEPEPESETDALEDIFSQAYANYRSSYFLAYNPLGHDRSVTSIAVSSNGQLIASGSKDETINIWHSQTGRLLRTLEGHEGGVNSLAIAPDGYTIVSGSDDGTIRVWNGNTGELLRTLEGHTGRLNSVAIASDGRTIVSGSSDRNIMVWDWIDWELNAIIEGHGQGVNSVAIAPDGSTIVSGSDDRNIMVWDLATLDLKTTLEGHEGSVNSVAIASDGRTIVSGSRDETIMVWDWTSWELKLIIEGHESQVNTVRVSSDGKTIFSGSDDRSIRVWDLATGELKNIFQDRNSAQILGFDTSYYEQIIVGGMSDRSIRIWHTK
ncbi:trypsin-like peptidase domain-containing protein [Waterburya agarophytonicola K14]|uniref:Trypsin-like peptidase domain-containing protein n=1 Tax=Waterburya agarophytonicola KI4 TaxID=2874699 RepID=A0A964FER3_9CYAN|nr:trypsin-like peptidase domain-containing protein [Waterburya agarophytonicola]MCC0176156.1 trypsin-like peptidase domain-containing protein [Waterburya agarophytonicola KI4]